MKTGLYLSVVKLNGPDQLILVLYCPKLSAYYDQTSALQPVSEVVYSKYHTFCAVQLHWCTSYIKHLKKFLCSQMFLLASLYHKSVAQTA